MSYKPTFILTFIVANNVYENKFFNAEIMAAIKLFKNLSFEVSDKDKICKVIIKSSAINALRFFVHNIKEHLHNNFKEFSITLDMTTFNHEYAWETEEMMQYCLKNPDFLIQELIKRKSLYQKYKNSPVSKLTRLIKGENFGGWHHHYYRLVYIWRKLRKTYPYVKHGWKY